MKTTLLAWAMTVWLTTAAMAEQNIHTFIECTRPKWPMDDI